MRAVLQRVQYAKLDIEGKTFAEIAVGILVLVGIEDIDNEEDIRWLSAKICNLRIFNDADGVMNLSVKDVGGELLVVSQFTLHASTKKGNRPSYLRASKPDFAVPMYEKFIKQVETDFEKPIKTGKFGADMKIQLLNDGPVTIIFDTKNKE